MNFRFRAKKVLPRLFKNSVSLGNKFLICRTDPASGKIFDLIKLVRKEKEMLLTDLEAYSLYKTILGTQKINGDIAEVGVYKGGSAKLICGIKGGKALHLFDTFEGLPELSKVDNSGQFCRGDYAAPLSGVQEFLKNYKNVYFYNGIFPKTAEGVKNKKFSFVHLDADFYESTLNSLDFFYPRMSRGGVMFLHDYPSAKGVKKALDEFMEDKQEIIITLSGCNQGLVVRL